MRIAMSLNSIKSKSVFVKEKINYLTAFTATYNYSYKIAAEAASVEVKDTTDSPLYYPENLNRHEDKATKVCVPLLGRVTLRPFFMEQGPRQPAVKDV
jgi:hypothetical protein